MYLGWVRGGVLGATLISTAFILPSFFMVYYHSYDKKSHIAAFVSGGTAAAAGAIAGAAFVLGKRAIIDLPTAAIALVTLAALLKRKKAPEPVVIIIAGAVGIAITSLR